jgi:hypothetical protein
MSHSSYGSASLNVGPIVKQVYRGVAHFIYLWQIEASGKWSATFKAWAEANISLFLLQVFECGKAYKQNGVLVWGWDLKYFSSVENFF